MKKEFLWIFIFIIFSSTIISAQQNPIPTVNEDDSVVVGVQKLKEFTEEQRWDFLAQEWKESLLNKPVIARIDNSLKKISWLFSILFGQPYELSVSLFLSILFWIVGVAYLYGLVSMVSPFQNKTSFIIGLGFNIALAQLNVFSWIGENLFKVIFFSEKWYWRVIAFLIVLLIWLFALAFYRYWRTQKRKSEVKEAGEELKHHVDVASKYTEAYSSVGEE